MRMARQVVGARPNSAPHTSLVLGGSSPSVGSLPSGLGSDQACGPALFQAQEEPAGGGDE
jgi:hypothetical protein